MCIRDRYTYNQVLERFGSDKPDIRFGMELFDLTDIVKDCGFAVFKNAKMCIRDSFYTDVCPYPWRGKAAV